MARTTRTARDSTARDRGAATAELAVALPSLVVVLLLALHVQLAVSAHLRCTDAAGAAARAAARGETDAVVVAAATAVAPDGAQVEVGRADGLVRVAVSAQVRPLGGVLGGLGTLAVHGRATAADESAVGAP
jgi:Flp pilus assembly protein TadG